MSSFAGRHFAPLVIATVALVCGCTTPRGAEDIATISAIHISNDFALDGNLEKKAWRSAKPALLARESRTAAPRPDLATPARALWSDRFLYLAFDCPFTKLTVFEPVQTKERFGLWERDVVEAFIGADASNIRHYTEFEVSPTNERLDLILNGEKRDFDWSSRFESATRVDEKKKRWSAEIRIPLAALSDVRPERGTRWRINLYRCDYANKALLALNPTLTGTFHTPERYGVLKFQ